MDIITLIVLIIFLYAFIYNNSPLLQLKSAEKRNERIFNKGVEKLNIQSFQQLKEKQLNKEKGYFMFFDAIYSKNTLTKRELHRQGLSSKLINDISNVIDIEDFVYLQILKDNEVIFTSINEYVFSDANNNEIPVDLITIEALTSLEESIETEENTLTIIGINNEQFFHFCGSFYDEYISFTQ